MEVCNAGLLTTVQDIGRTGYASRGFRENGACDKYAMRLANMLAGNEPDRTAVLECTFQGPVLRFSSDTVIAVTGADMEPAVNGQQIPRYTACPVKAGDVLKLHTAVCGLRAYLAVAGGFLVSPVMGSYSTDLQCGLGGFHGRALQEGDILETQEKASARLAGRSISAAAPWLRQPSNPYRIMGGSRTVMLRVVPGPQEDAFTIEGMQTFERNLFCLTANSDRMACKLEGPPIETKNGSDIISDGIVEGSVQIAADGQPIVMLADHQTTGGYAKIGTVISVDIPALAQLKPGDYVAFKFVEYEEALRAYRQEQSKLDEIKKSWEGRNE